MTELDTAPPRTTGPTSTNLPAEGRTVLNGAFALLESLGSADQGMGLSELARASGLAKSSTYRLAEQLVCLGAIQRVARRYYVGPRVGHIGRQWHPDPRLRQAGTGPVRTLAMHTGACAALRILEAGRLTVICATARRGHVCTLAIGDPESVARTATGRVLYAAQTADGAELPACWSPREWRRLQARVREQHAVVVDEEDVFPGNYCVSSPVWWPSGECAGAVTVLLHGSTPNTRIEELVIRTARDTECALAESTDSLTGHQVVGVHRRPAELHRQL